MDKDLWTNDFKKMVLGDIISYIGSALMAFILGYHIYESTGSVLSYGIYLIINNACTLIIPIFAAPFLDRFSRKKTIYICDFLSGLLFFAVWLILGKNSFSTILCYATIFIIAIINSLYELANESFFPLLVSEDKLTKAYTMISNFAILSGAAVPIGLIVRKLMGERALFIIASVFFVTAAMIERTIKTEEKQIAIRKDSRICFKSFFTDFSEGFRYIRGRKVFVILFISLFSFYILMGSILTLELPYFQRNFGEYGYYWYIVYAALNASGRFVSNSCLYFFERKWKHNKYLMANILLFSGMLIITFLFYFPLPFILILIFIFGFEAALLFNYRAVSVQKELDNFYRARFSSVALFIINGGMIIGELLGGVLEGFFSISMTLMIIGIICTIVSVYTFTFSGHDEIKALFDRE